MIEDRMFVRHLSAGKEGVVMAHNKILAIVAEDEDASVVVKNDDMVVLGRLDAQANKELDTYNMSRPAQKKTIAQAQAEKRLAQIELPLSKG